MAEGILRPPGRLRFSVLLLAIICIGVDAAAQTVVVHVTSDGQPIAGARVRTSAAEATTNRDGEATIAAGSADTLRVEAEGFLPATLTIPAFGDTRPIEVSLEPLAEFEEAIVVSAARSPTRLEDQPLRVEVIDQEDIEEKALMTPGSVAMLIGETTGLRVQPTAPSLGAANVRIQGLRGRYSQLLADGLPLYGGQGDSFSLLQVPPLDLGRVEIIKGVASALYGASALGGVVNLVARRPEAASREVLLNVTSRAGTDSTVWLADVPSESWRWSVLGGFHRQGRRDLDGDGWTDVAGFERGTVRPRVFFDNQRGTTVTATVGALVEDRVGGTLVGRVAPDGGPFAESLHTARGDAGLVARWLVAGDHVLAVRGSYGRQSRDRQAGLVREHGTRDTGFGEASIQGATGRHTWVLGGAFQHDGYRSPTFSALGYSFDAPGVFAQDEVVLGAVRLALSGRVDVHDEYGVLATPRVSTLWRPEDDWTVRVSAGGGAFAPTPFVEQTDETGFSRLAPLAGLDAERAWGGSIDVTRRIGGLEVNGTWFQSTVRNPVQFVTNVAGQSMLRHGPGPTHTWGSEALARYRLAPLVATATYAYTRSREFDPDDGVRREVPLTPRHYAALDVMVEDVDVGRAGLELYYVGRQRLDDNPYRERSVGQFIVGALVEKRFRALRVFANAENLGGIRQTRYDPLTRPARHPDGRWTVDAWSPLDGRVVNGGIRVFF